MLCWCKATSIVVKLFELPHDAMFSTPTGMFMQLISKVFHNLDKLMPAGYGVVIPMAMEVVIAVCVIGALYGAISLVQLLLFLIYSVVAYRAATKKAQRNAEMMGVMLSEWGKIVATANSYERAHFFGNVEHEVRHCYPSE